jgi:chromosomal replication initiator protein
MPDITLFDEGGAAEGEAGEVASTSNTLEHTVKKGSGTGVEGKGQKIRATLRARVGEEVYSSWFKSMEFEAFDGEVVRVSVPVKFLRKWILSHYSDHLLECCRTEFASAQRVDVILREPGNGNARPMIEVNPREAARRDVNGPAAGAVRSSGPARPMSVMQGRTSVAGVEGSPLDPRYTFDSFVVSSANRMAHAGARQVADALFGEARGFNPLYIHSSVGLGKTHLLQAIAWEVQRRAPHGHVLYLTAERFRYQFVEALRSQDGLAFKDKFRAIDILLIDDLEFLSGQQTEQEFDHVINTLLDGGRQVVVACSRAPSQIDKLNERMRSRLQRGLVIELGTLDYELRLKILERRVQERQHTDPTFELSRQVLELLAEKLTESGRELEGAVTRLNAHWQYVRTTITPEVADSIIRDLVNGAEPRRIKIEEILKVISRHYGISRGDIISQRRHRSIVWPRQIGMYLSKQLTQRSLPEIGRRFGGRDHTTVLHAIRKIEGELKGNPRLREELDDLKKLLAN